MSSGKWRLFYLGLNMLTKPKNFPHVNLWFDKNTFRKLTKGSVTSGFRVNKSHALP